MIAMAVKLVAFNFFERGLKLILFCCAGAKIISFMLCMFIRIV